MGYRDEIVGRDIEFAAIERFLESDPPRLLSINGAAGIGKTTLLLAAVERARELGYRVLPCRPAETERDLSFAGLTTLLNDAIVDEIAPHLPGPRLRALETERGPGDGADVGQRVGSIGPRPSRRSTRQWSPP